MKDLIKRNLNGKRILLLFVLTFLLIGCSSEMELNKPSYILSIGKWQTYSSQHFNFYYRLDSKSASWIDSISVVQESNLHKLSKFLNREDIETKIQFFIFPSLTEKATITGEKARAHTVPVYDAVYYIDSDTINNVLGQHEIGHYLLRKYFGVPVKGFYKTFIDEGFAWYCGDSLAGERRYEYYTEKLKEHSILTPYDYLKKSDLMETNWDEFMRTAGAFSKYLLDNYELDKYVRLLLEGKNEEDFETIYGVSIKSASDKFVNYLSHI